MALSRVRTLTTFKTGDPDLDRYQEHVKQTLTPVLGNPLLSAADFRFAEVQSTTTGGAPTFALQYRSTGTTWTTIATFNSAGQLQALVTQPTSAFYHASATQTVGAGATAIINFDSKDYDTDTAVTTGASWKFTVPTGKPGLYHASATINFAAWGNAGDAFVDMFKNGAEFLSGAPRSAQVGQADFHVSGALLLAAGDTLDFRLFNGTVASQTTEVATRRNWCSIYRIAGGL